MSILTDAQMKIRVSNDLERVETYLQQALQTGAEDFNALIRPLSAGGGKRLRAQLCLLIALSGDPNKKIEFVWQQRLRCCTWLHSFMMMY